MKREVKKFNKLALYAFISVLCLLMTFVIAVLLSEGKGNFDVSLLLFDRVNIFGDFAEVLSYCVTPNVYETKIIYLPFAFLIFYPFLLICNNDVMLYVNNQISLNDLCNSSSFLIAYAIYVIISLAIIIFLLLRLFKIKQNKIYFVTLIISFGAIYFCFIRGNIMFTAFIFLLLFLNFYKNEKKHLKEFALIMLACAIVIKPYLMCFALFLLKEKDLWAIVRCGVYSLFIAIFPFVFIDGNFSNISILFDNLKNFLEKSSTTTFSRISTDAAVCYVAFAIKYCFFLDLGSFCKYVVWILNILILVMLFIIIIRKNKNISEFYYLILVPSIYCLLQTSSFQYCLVTFLPAFIYFIYNFKMFSLQSKIVYGIIFFIFACPFMSIAKLNCLFVFAVLFVYLYTCVILLKNKDVFVSKNKKHFITFR